MRTRSEATHVFSHARTAPTLSLLLHELFLNSPLTSDWPLTGSVSVRLSDQDIDNRRTAGCPDCPID